MDLSSFFVLFAQRDCHKLESLIVPLKVQWDEKVFTCEIGNQK